MEGLAAQVQVEQVMEAQELVAEDLEPLDKVTMVLLDLQLQVPELVAAVVVREPLVEILELVAMLVTLA
jgi:hypothetical protein